VKQGDILEVLGVMAVLFLWGYGGYEYLAVGQVGLVGYGGLILAFLIMIAVVNRRVKDVLSIKATSALFIRLTLILVISALATSFAYIGYFHLGIVEAAAVLTVIAEGLGFIGLCLVELTIFLWVRRLRRISYLSLRLEGLTLTPIF
jgi:hypothetical protein